MRTEKAEDSSNKDLRFGTTKSQDDGVVYARAMRWITRALVVVAMTGCGERPDASTKVTAEDLVGEWRAVLQSPGGELPFGLRFVEREGSVVAIIINDVEEVPTSAVVVSGDRVTVEMSWYDSALDGRLSGDGRRIDGRWSKTVPDGVAVLPWSAERGAVPRFRPLSGPSLGSGDMAALPDLSGVWRVHFADEDGGEEARGEFRQHGSRVTGTVLTATGDYRFLDGVYELGLLRLSTFDGAHAFLFRAKSRRDGRLEGDFWSRDSYHVKWTAELIASGEDVLPDPWGQVSPTRGDRRFRFQFPDLEGTMVGFDDPRFKGKVVLVNLFGSWCPNCNDEAPLLAGWHQRWADDGLEIVGLAFEFSGEPERDCIVLRRFAERYGIRYPLLLAGVSDKTEAGKMVPDLSAVLSYPTTVFIGRDGVVRWIHSGFAGPGTGPHHDELVAEMERRIEELLSEPLP